jgi:single-strand DNA-binding protein
MAGETVITIIGNLTNDPELRFTPSGAAVANFTVASTPRALDRESNQWKDGDPLFLRCSVWRQYAENVAESLTKGMQVIVQGRLKQREYETKEGEKRRVVELDVDEIGPCLKWATAKVARASGGNNSSGWKNADNGGNRGGQVQRSGPAQGGQPQQQGEDPWAQQSGGGWGSGYSDEPPF